MVISVQFSFKSIVKIKGRREVFKGYNLLQYFEMMVVKEKVEIPDFDALLFLIW